MRAHRLDDHIRELCAKVVSAHDKEFQPFVIELKNALHEHTRRLRRIAAQKLIQTAPSPDRRKFWRP